jgi:nucleoid-associated protein YgaU
VFQGSRYGDAEVITPIAHDGSRRRILDMRRITVAFSTHEHTVREGERLDQLASRFYGDPQKYWLILDANPEELNPFRLLRTGHRIRIPRNRV